MPSGIHENHAKGEQHYRARLTPDKVRQILASNDTTPALAKRFGVNSGTIHDVRVRRPGGMSAINKKAACPKDQTLPNYRS